MREQLSEAQHHAVDERQEKVDGGAADQAPYRRRLVQDDRRVRRLLARGVVFAVGVHRDAGLGEGIGHGEGGGVVVLFFGVRKELIQRN